MSWPPSPRPPSGMMRQTPIGAESMALRAGGGEQPGALAAGADLSELRLVGFDHRQPVPAHLVAGEIERRLYRNRVRLDPQPRVGRLLLLVQSPRSLDVAVAVAADHLRDLRSPQVLRHGHPSDPAALQEGERVRIVARVEVEWRLLGDEAGLGEGAVCLLDREKR